MAGITMSVTFPLDADLSSQAGWLPLVTGLVVAEAISEVTGVAATLKWPNDVLLPADDDRKVCGVLCEIVPMKPSVENDLGGPPRPLVPVVPLVVVGIGLNVRPRITRELNVNVPEVGVWRRTLSDAGRSRRGHSARTPRPIGQGASRRDGGRSCAGGIPIAVRHRREREHGVAAGGCRHPGPRDRHHR